MSVKAKLTVRLLAQDVVVAESEDENLWRRVLATIQGAGSSEEAADSGSLTREDPGLADGDEAGSRRSPVGRTTGLSAMAKALRVSTAEIEGACSPGTEEPFLHLDEHCWEAMRKSMPKRGPGLVAPIQLAATLLCLWYKYGQLEGAPTQAQAQAVLDTIGARDNNPSRSIKNCVWLQTRSGSIRINAARHSLAERVAKGYVTQSKIEWE